MIITAKTAQMSSTIFAFSVEVSALKFLSCSVCMNAVKASISRAEDCQAIQICDAKQRKPQIATRFGAIQFYPHVFGATPEKRCSGKLPTTPRREKGISRSRSAPRSWTWTQLARAIYRPALACTRTAAPCQIVGLILATLVPVLAGCSKPAQAQAVASHQDSFPRAAGHPLYKFILGHDQVLWRVDIHTGAAWWTVPGQNEYWHKILEPSLDDVLPSQRPAWQRAPASGPDFSTLRPLTNQPQRNP